MISEIVGAYFVIGVLVAVGVFCLGKEKRVRDSLTISVIRGLLWLPVGSLWIVGQARANW